MQQQFDEEMNRRVVTVVQGQQEFERALAEMSINTISNVPEQRVEEDMRQMGTRKKPKNFGRINTPNDRSMDADRQNEHSRLM